MNMVFFKSSLMKKEILLFLISSISFSQSFEMSLKVGDKLPPLTFTHYHLNEPKNKNFDKKFKVLEFWATWCAPCLEAVPHLNELQEKFNQQKNLVFISITDETPQKVQNTLKRIPFKSIVVSDVNKNIHLAAKVAKKIDNSGPMIISVPRTILVDDQNIVRWVGYPKELNEKILHDFLEGKYSISHEKGTIIISSNASEKDNDTLIKKIDALHESSKSLKEEDTAYEKDEEFTFGGTMVIANSNNKNQVSGNNKPHDSQKKDLSDVIDEMIFDPQNKLFLKIGFVKYDKEKPYYYSSGPGYFSTNGIKLIPLLSYIFNVPEPLIQIDEHLKDEYVEFYYADDIRKRIVNPKKSQNFDELLQNLIIRSLGLKKVVQKKSINIWIWKIADRKKLIPSEKGSDGHGGENSTHYVYQNQRLKDVVSNLVNSTGFLMEVEEDADKMYDFLIKKPSSIEDLINELSTYGIRLERKTVEKEFLIFQEQ